MGRKSNVDAVDVAQKVAPSPLNSLSVGIAGGTISRMNTALGWFGSSTAQSSSPVATKPVAVITPTSEEYPSASDSPAPFTTAEEARPPPPSGLKRQQSHNSGWLSEIDSHYHSDDNDDESSREGEPRNTPMISDVDSQGSFRPPRIVTATVSPPKSPSTAFAHVQMSGDETSETSNVRGRYRRKKRNKSLSVNDSSNAVLAIYQERLAQAEVRTANLSQRLALAERNHRDATEDLRDARWETTRLEELVQEQRVKITKLEEEQQITQEWQASQERSALVDDLKAAQDKLLSVEEQKMGLLKELTMLQKKVGNDAIISAKQLQEKEELVERFDKLHVQVNHLTSLKETVEKQLHEALLKQQQLEIVVQNVSGELQVKQAANNELEETNRSLTKRVRFVDEQLEAVEHRNTELEVRLETLESESERARQDFGQQIQILESSIKVLHSERQDLYQAWQMALESQRKTLSELDELRATHTKDTARLHQLSSELESALSAKKDMEMSYQIQLQEQSDLLAQEKVKAQTQQEEYEARLDETLKQVMQMQRTLESSQVNIQRLEAERQELLAVQSSLHARLEANQVSFDEIDTERSSLKQALEEIQVEHASLWGQSQKDHSVLLSQLQQAEAEAVKRQLETLKERRALEHEILLQTNQVRELEARVHSLEKERETFASEKEELVQQAAELQASLLDEGPKLALKEMEADRDRLREAVESLRESRIALEEELQDSVNKVAELEARLVQAFEQTIPLQQQADSATERATSLAIMLSQAQKQAYDLELAHTELSAEHTKLLSDRQTSESKIEELRISTNVAEDRIRGLEDSRQELQQKIDKLDASRIALEVELEEATSRYTDLESSHTVSRNSLETELADSRCHVANLQGLISSQESKIESLEENFKVTIATVSKSGKAEVDALRAEMAALKSASDKELETLYSELSLRKEQLASLGTELDDANKTLHRSTAALDAARSESESLWARLAVSASSVEYLDKEWTSSKAEVDWLKAERDALVVLRNDLRARLEEGEVQIRTLIAEKQALQSELLLVRDENHTLASKLQDAMTGREQLEAQLSESTDLNKALEEVLMGKENEIVLLQSIDNELRAKVGNLQDQLSKLSAIRDDLAAEHESIQTKHEQTLLTLSHKVDAAETEKTEFKMQLQELQSESSVLMSQKSSVEDRSREIEKSLLMAENLVRKTSDELSRASHERDASLLLHRALQEQNLELQRSLEDMQRSMDETVAEKYRLCSEKYELSEKLKGVEASFSELQANNQDVLSRNVQLEIQSNRLRQEVESIQSQKFDLMVLYKEQSDSTAELVAVLRQEKDDLLGKVNMLETEKAEKIEELSIARDAVSQLELSIERIADDAQQSSARLFSTAKDISSLEENKAALEQEVTKLSAELGVVYKELQCTKTLARETEEKLAQAEVEKALLAEEKRSAIVRQSELEGEAYENRLTIASLEKGLRQLEADLRALESAKESVEAEKINALLLVEKTKGDEEKVKKALSDAERTISDLKVENSKIAFRVEKAEGSIADLKTDTEKANYLGCLAVENLGKKLLEDKGTIRELSGELEASKQTNTALKRAAKYLITRVRELENQIGKKETSLVFSCDLSPARHASRRVSLSSQDSQGIPSDSFDSTRAIQEPITLSMYYRSNDEGKLQSYEVRSKYTGPLLNGLPHGPGMLRFENKEMILAEFEQGEICGVAAFSHRQRYNHANMVVFGTFETDRFAGNVDDVPPIQRVRAERVSLNK